MEQSKTLWRCPYCGGLCGQHDPKCSRNDPDNVRLQIAMGTRYWWERENRDADSASSDP